ncbi:hypothetical protein PENANT_c009G07336 [Penicillium antarcticum]|uniref:Ig-like domain-containing protein n=1 Tax=Penicillium antarcticum TaxID=416450 RepID=A0A1V6Q8R4_9EURO|nr:hypothetical protein PENANT_c009G07336 [Penicillium antarcticum]
MTSLTRFKMSLLIVVSMVSMGMAAALGEDCTSIVKVLLQNPHTGATHVLGDNTSVSAPVPNLFGRAVHPDDGWSTITTTVTSCTPHVPLATTTSTLDSVVVPIVSSPPIISHTSTVTTSYTTTSLETGTLPTTSVAVSASASAPTDVITTVVPAVTSTHVSGTTEVSVVSSESTTSKVTATATEVTTQSGTPMSSSSAPASATSSTTTAKPMTSFHPSSVEKISASSSSSEVAFTVTGKSTDHLTEPCPTETESTPAAGKITGVPPTAAPPALMTTEIVYTVTVPCSHTEKCRSTEVYSTSTLVISKPTGTHVTAPATSKVTSVPVSGSIVTGEATDFVTEPCPTDTEMAPAPTPVTTEVVFTITVPCSYAEKCRSTEVYSTSTLVFSNPTRTQVTAPTAPAVIIVPAPVTVGLPPAPAVTEITMTLDISCTESTKCVSTKVLTTAISVSVVPVVPIAVTVPTPETTEVPVSAPAPLEATFPQSPPQVKVSESVSEPIITTKPAAPQTTLATVPQQVPHEASHSGETQIAVSTVPHPPSSETLTPSAPVFNGASTAGLVDGRLLTVSIFVVLANAAHFVIL